MSRIRITRAVEFSASLRYQRPELSPEENRRLFGRQAAKHGHNYRLEVTLEGEPDPETGMVMDLKRLQDVLDREVVERFDHRDLNEQTPYFEKLPPTPERVASVLFGLLDAALPPGLLRAIRLRQDEDTWVDVVAEGPER